MEIVYENGERALSGADLGCGALLPLCVEGTAMIGRTIQASCVRNVSLLGQYYIQSELWTWDCGLSYGNGAGGPQGGVFLSITSGPICGMLDCLCLVIGL